MNATRKDCTSVQKTRCPSAIPGGFQSPPIASWHQLPTAERGTSPCAEHEGRPRWQAASRRFRRARRKTYRITSQRRHQVDEPGLISHGRHETLTRTISETLKGFLCAGRPVAQVQMGAPGRRFTSRAGWPPHVTCMAFHPSPSPHNRNKTVHVLEIRGGKRQGGWEEFHCPW